METIYSSENLCENSSDGLTVFVVEDEYANYKYVSTILIRELSAKIIHAKDGGEAIEMFKANPDIRIVLMDIKIPVIDGLEVTRQIKKIRPDIPVIAITAYAMPGDMERVLAAGCDAYLSKPLSKNDLLKKIALFV
jgi:two-component system, cell cycle response regulator DivK